MSYFQMAIALTEESHQRSICIYLKKMKRNMLQYLVFPTTQDQDEAGGLQNQDNTC